MTPQVKRRWLWRLIRSTAVAAVLLFFTADFLAKFAMTVPPMARSSFSPTAVGIPTETVRTITRDGVHVVAWWVPQTGGKRPVIVVHGLGASKELMMNYILLAHREGHPVLAIDLRGHGESDKGPTTLGWREPQDVVAWEEWLKAKGFERPILWGTSLGAVTCLRAAAMEQDLAGGVIADAPFDTLRHTMAIHGKLFFGLPEYPFTPLTVWRLQQKLDFRVADVDSLAAVRAIHVPVFIIAAGEDHRMPLPTVRAIFDAANEPKRWWVIPGADHETRSFEPDFCAQISAFLQSVP